MLVGGVNKGVIDAVQYARSLAPERLIAVSVVTDHEEQEELASLGGRSGCRSRCTRSLALPRADPTGAAVPRRARRRARDDIITVVIPEFVTQWKTQWLHNQSPFALKARLLYRPNTAVVSVPIHTHGDDDGRAVGATGMHVIVVGCGRVGSEVALNLAWPSTTSS